MLRTLGRTLGAWTILATLGAMPIGAQSGVTITGTVKDTAGVPIDGAEVAFGSRMQARVTGSQGAFRLDQVEAGRDWLYVRRLGYAPVRHALTLRAGTTRRLEVILEPLPARLPDVEVVAQSGFKARRMADFWGRSYMAWGRFFTRDDIDRYAELSHVVRQALPFAILDFADLRPGSDPGRARFSFAGGRQPRDCVPALSIDGAPPFGFWYVNDFRPSEIEAMEVYRPGIARIPAEYAFYRQAAACGLVVVWLR